jgi:glycosyltransferase involved in cell wall biosynthesis
MKLLHTAHVYPPETSGVSRIVSEIAQGLARRGHEVHVATAARPNSPSYEMSAGIHIHRFDIFGNSVLGIHGNGSAYIRFVLQGDWDCITVYNAQTWSTDLLLDHLAHLPPTVLSFQGLSAVNNPRYLHYFEALKAAASENVGRVVCVSRSSEDWTFFRTLQPDKVSIIPNGIDPAEWASPSRNLRKSWGIGGRPWIVNVSNHNPAKNHALLLRTAQLVQRRVPDLAVTIIGTHHQQERWPILRPLRLRGGCWYRCQWMSRRHPFVALASGIPRVSVVSAVQEADAFLLTSAWEASPVVIGEAMAAAVPWVSTDVGDISERTGGIVANSEEGLANACESVLTDPNRARALGAAGRSAMGGRDWGSIASEYEAIYSELVGPRIVQPG